MAQPPLGQRLGRVSERDEVLTHHLGVRVTGAELALEVGENPLVQFDRLGRAPPRKVRGSWHANQAPEWMFCTNELAYAYRFSRHSYSAGRMWIVASGLASPVLWWYGRRVGGLGPGLTS